MKFLKLITAASVCAFSALPLCTTKASADGIFRPDTFKVTFYQIGFRNSTTGTLNPVLNSSSGVEADLSNAGSSLSLASSQTPSEGNWDQIYALIKNSIKVSGTDGNGCFIKDGASAIADDGTAIVTTNSSESGEGTTTSMFYDGAGDFGPYSPDIASSVNGSAVTDLKEYLVSDSNPTPSGGGTINRFLYIGNITPITISDGSSGTIIYTIDTSEAGEMHDNCSKYSFGNLNFNMSVIQN